MTAAEIVEKILHISEKPWSDYTEADYTLQQWHVACLIHQHTGPPTSKSQCKLPVKTPNGALNRNGVHAAAAALAGARSPINATPEQKAKAASALRGYYNQLGETPPDSLKQDAMRVENLLAHHGVKGMKWGVRRKATVGPREVIVSDKRKTIKTKGGGGHPAHPEAVRARTTGQIAKKSGVKALSDQQLNEYAKRLRLEQEVKRLQYQDKPAAHRFILKALGRSGNQTVDQASSQASKKVGMMIAAKQAAKVATVAA